MRITSVLQSSAATSPSAGLDAGEADLLARVAAGDAGTPGAPPRGPPAAPGAAATPLRALYRRYEGRLYGLGVRLLGDPGLAEELVQETFVRVWQGADRFDPARGSVRGLVFTIARRVAIDLWRRPSSRTLGPEPPSWRRTTAPPSGSCSRSRCATR
jgi:hypothetical protein